MYDGYSRLIVKNVGGLLDAIETVGIFLHGKVGICPLSPSIKALTGVSASQAFRLPIF